MPRNRFVWHVFAGCCAIVAATAAAACWIASIQLAGLADAALRDRLTDVGRGLAAATAAADGGIDRSGFEAGARSLRESSRIDCRLIDGIDATGADDTVAAARRDGIASRSRYDSGSGRRSLEVALPVPSSPRSVILVTADAADSDRKLANWQRTLLLGCLAVTGTAAAIAYALARQLARPLDGLRAAAARLASGDVRADPPATDVAEFADLAAALVRLREQLVERGLTIGRQDTQQEAVLGSMIEGVLAIDGRRRILGINRAAADLLDVEADEAAGRPMQDVIRNPDLRRFALTAIDCREPVEDDLLLRGSRTTSCSAASATARSVSAAPPSATPRVTAAR